jgi:UDP-GlcNAc:undecaprenyl-phosphate GlcNAc-1-phosphate transferase
MTAPVVATTAFATGAVITAGATPLAIRLAHRLRFYDRPAGYKQHGRSTPYLGGLALVVGLLGAVAISGTTGRHYLPLVAGTALIWLLGTVDDRLNLSPLVRVVAEIALAVWLWSADLGWDLVASDVVNLAVTVGWVVVVVNAFNLMDNMDGAASATGAVAAVGIGVFALLNHDPALAAITFGAAGAASGFLPANLRRPAKIFLGDGGSMVIGFVVAATAMSGPLTGDLGFGAVLCACMVAGLPLLDTTLVVISRRRRGVAILSGARDHLTHRLLALVGTPRRVCLMLAVAGTALASSTAVAADAGRPTVLWVATVWVAAGIAAIGALERTSDRQSRLARVPDAERA